MLRDSDKMKATKEIKNPDLAFVKSIEIAKSIHNIILRNTALEILKDNEQAFKSIKGSDWQHHNYKGGLIVHTYNVTKTAVNIAEYYAERVDTDLVKFGALMHDVGKLFDYSLSDTFVINQNVSMNQSLLGHGYEGASYVHRVLLNNIKNQDNYLVIQGNEYIESLISQCIHVIGCHMEGFGAISKQQMLEAMIISKADCLDAYLCQTVMEENKETNEFVVGTGEKFYRSVINKIDVVPLDESANILRRDWN